jgi:hypothetical protein
MATISWAGQPRIAQFEATNFGKTLLFVALLTSCLRKESDFIVFGWACIGGVFHGAFMHVVGTKFGYVPGRFSEEYGVFPDDHNGVLVAMFPLLCMYSLYARTTMQRCLSCLVLALVVVSIVNTYRRTPLMGVVCQAFSLALLIPRQRLLKVLPYVLVASLVIGIRSMPSDWWERMATIMTPTQESSANSRFIIHKAFWHMAIDHPLGVGYRNSLFESPAYLDTNMLTNSTRSAHNTYLTILTETGFLGFSLWAIAVTSAFVRLNSLRKWFFKTGQSGYWVSCVSAMTGLLGWCAIGWTASHNELDPAYWFMGMAVALGRIREQQLASSEIPIPSQPSEQRFAIEGGDSIIHSFESQGQRQLSL